jgi:formylglycine-generating enzyme required for sulfatase activity
MCRIKLLLQLALAVAKPAAHAQDFIRIPAGPMTMGSNNGRKEKGPENIVTLAAFEIDRLQAMNTEFAMFLERHGITDSKGRRYFDWDDNDAPYNALGVFGVQTKGL